MGRLLRAVVASEAEPVAVFGSGDVLVRLLEGEGGVGRLAVDPGPAPGEGGARLTRDRGQLCGQVVDVAASEGEFIRRLGERGAPVTDQDRVARVADYDFFFGDPGGQVVVHEIVVASAHGEGVGA